MPSDESDSPAAGETHRARKALFARGIQRGWLLLAEIAKALPPGTLSEAERWLLLVSLRAANVELRADDGHPVDPLAGGLVPPAFA